jgi:hypothetical protein
MLLTDKPKFYVAGSWLRRDELKERAEEIERRGGKVTSTWLTKFVDPRYKHSRYGTGEKDVLSDVIDMESAIRDLEAIDEAEVLVLQSEAYGRYTTGGRLVEFGYALGRGKMLAIVSRVENVFGHLPRVFLYRHWQDFYTWVEVEATKRRLFR